MAKVKLCPKKLGRELGVLRGQMPLEQLSEKSGLSVEYLRNLEAGDVRKVRKKELKRLSRALSMPTPCIKFMGVEPGEVPDKVMSKLAGAVQDAIKAVVEYRAEIENGEDEQPAAEPKKKKKKKE